MISNFAIDKSDPDHRDCGGAASLQLRDTATPTCPQGQGATVEALQNICSGGQNEAAAHLAYAARLILHASGHSDAAGIAKERKETSPKRAIKLKKVYHLPKVQAHEYPPEEALPLSM
ncbi:hypothetical protein EVAR_70863_1 [Eumeta japonica]|uniref:Uncharacterized protein n=1 Tax=Eumeta variegata TaxID=151549 RepID=A0A4C2AC99_EUMVA|nr:hypothetical protein EVAR_70863_1 [Eumeta japonica]